MKELGVINKWTADNLRLMPNVDFSSDEVDHIVMCLHHISRWYFEDFPLGNFLTAVVENDFCEAVFRADDINRKVLYLYALFCYNHLPGDWQVKADKQKKARR